MEGGKGGGTYGKFSTCVGTASKSLLDTPRALWTAPPMGKPEGKSRMPELTNEATSLATSLARLPT